MPKSLTFRVGRLLAHNEIYGLNQALEPEPLQRMFDEKGGIAPDRLRRLDVPTLSIAGEQDQLLPSGALRSAATLIEGAEFVLMPTCGHSTYFEDPSAFNRIVGDFIARH